MPTKRTPIKRVMHRRITAEAIMAFKRMETVKNACTCRGDEDHCQACEEFWAAHAVLHAELKLKPWQWPAIECPDEANPYPRNSEAGKSWLADRERRGWAVELYEELRRAA